MLQEDALGELGLPELRTLASNLRASGEDAVRATYLLVPRRLRRPTYLCSHPLALDYVGSPHPTHLHLLRGSQQEACPRRVFSSCTCTELTPDTPFFVFGTSMPYLHNYGDTLVLVCILQQEESDSPIDYCGELGPACAHGRPLLSTTCSKLQREISFLSTIETHLLCLPSGELSLGCQ